MKKLILFLLLIPVLCFGQGTITEVVQGKALDHKLDYVEYRSPKKTDHWLIFYQGTGEMGSGDGLNLPLVYKYGFGKLIKQGYDYDFNILFVQPKAYYNFKDWVLTWANQKYHPSKIIICGLSLGAIEPRCLACIESTVSTGTDKDPEQRGSRTAVVFDFDSQGKLGAARVRLILWYASIVAVATALTVLAVPANAAPHRVTYGEARAIFEAVGNAGLLIQRHSPVQMGAPQRSRLQAEIRPINFEGFDGRHYCVEDWHVIVLSLIYVGDASYLRPDAQAEADTITTFNFTLDGAALGTSQTTLKPYEEPEIFGAERGWWFQTGRLMSPSDLSVGRHTIAILVEDAFGSFEDGISFFIDASGTGACL